MEYQCEIKEQAPQPVLSIRTRASVEALPQELGRAYGAIAQYLCELGQDPAGAPFAAYYNLDMQDMDVEIGFPVAAQLPDKAEIQASQIPGGKQASCLYAGPYSGLQSAFEALVKWVADQGYEPTGVAYEMYLNDPTQVPPEELQTLIMFPLK